MLVFRVHDNKHGIKNRNALLMKKNLYSDMPRLHNEPNGFRFVFLFNYLTLVFPCVPVTKAAKFDWPRTLRSEVSTYNIDCMIQNSRCPLNSAV